MEGIDPTLCSIFAMAIFGNPGNYEMVNIPPEQADSALATRKVDVMLGNSYSTASSELSGHALPAATIYHDRLVFLAKTEEQPKSMEDFSNQNVCITVRSPDLQNFEQYVRTYDLKFHQLRFANFASAKASFLLNRCKLLVGYETVLADMKKGFANRKDIVMLPEEMDVRPGLCPGCQRQRRLAGNYQMDCQRPDYGGGIWHKLEKCRHHDRGQQPVTAQPARLQPRHLEKA